MNKAIRNLLNLVEENNRQYPYDSGKYIFSVTIRPGDKESVRIHTEWPAVLELINKKPLGATICEVTDEAMDEHSRHLTVLYNEVYYTCIVHRRELLKTLDDNNITIAVTQEGESVPTRGATMEDLINTCILKTGGDE